MQVFPLSPGGAAEAQGLGTVDGLAVADRTPWPRWGLKGAGAADWLAGAGLTLPRPNRRHGLPGLRILRLGGNDVTILSDPGCPSLLAALRAQWQAATQPCGWPSWCKEGWAWLHLSGPSLPGTLARLCAVDLRPGRFAPDAIAQTRFAHLDAVVIRDGDSAEMLFDITATAACLGHIRQAARDTSKGATP